MLIPRYANTIQKTEDSNLNTLETWRATSKQSLTVINGGNYAEASETMESFILEFVETYLSQDRRYTGLYELYIWSSSRVIYNELISSYLLEWLQAIVF